MAPPEQPFPVTELETRVHTRKLEYKDKNRKLGKDFNLKDCELYELIQYSCTPIDRQRQNAEASPDGKAAMECYPIVRLFRKCGHGNKMFHVETTAWEGPGAWKQEAAHEPKTTQDDTSHQNGFASYSGFVWSKK